MKIFTPKTASCNLFPLTSLYRFRFWQEMNFVLTLKQIFFTVQSKNKICLQNIMTSAAYGSRSKGGQYWSLLTHEICKLSTVFLLNLRKKGEVLQIFREILRQDLKVLLSLLDILIRQWLLPELQTGWSQTTPRRPLLHGLPLVTSLKYEDCTLYRSKVTGKVKVHGQTTKQRNRPKSH